jgi:hypothetical protein
MGVANNVIRKENAIGLLCCGAELVPFYERCSWRLLHTAVTREAVPHENFFVDTCVMACELAVDPPHILMSGDPF